MKIKKRKLPTVRKTTKLNLSFFKFLRNKKQLFVQIDQIPTDKQFRELFYSPKTLNVTRDFIVYGALPNSYEIIQKRLHEHPQAKEMFGKAMYKAQILYNKKTKKPAGFELVAITKRGIKPITWEDPTMRQVMVLTDRTHIARNIEQQMINKELDYAKGYKLLYGIDKTLDWINLSQKQIETTVNLHSRGAAIIESPTNPSFDKTNLQEVSDDDDSVAPGTYISEEDGAYKVKLGDFGEHAEHMINQFNQLDIFLKATGVSGEANNFIESYRNFKSKVLTLEDLSFDDIYEANEARKENIVKYGQEILDSLHNLRNTLLDVRISQKTHKHELDTIEKLRVAPEITDYETKPSTPKPFKLYEYEEDWYKINKKYYKKWFSKK